MWWNTKYRRGTPYSNTRPVWTLDISRWRFDKKDWHLVPGINDPSKEGGLPTVQPERPLMKFQVMNSKAGKG